MVGLPKVKRGGGPKTEAGKFASSMNAIKTGAYTSHVTIPGESEDDFQKLFDEFVDSLLPQGVFEQSMVHDLAIIAWKKHRLDKLEQSGLSRVLSSPVVSYDFRADINIPSEYDWLITDLSIMTEDFIKDSRSHLTFIRSLGDQGISNDELLQLPKTNPGLYQLIVDDALETYTFREDVNPTPELLLSLSRTNEAGSKEPFVSSAISKIHKRSEQVLWVSFRLVEIENAIKAFKERRLLKLMQDVGLMRARDDLGRAFSRTLAEFRRQQQWRIKLATDVNSVSE